MVEIFNGNWSKKDVMGSDKVFVYGDNNLRYGEGGQAIIRSLPNTIGLRTKKEPNNNPSSFYSDDDYSDNILRIKEDIKKIKKIEDSGKIIVFSQGGYGTGLARLKTLAPKTFEYLNNILFEYFEFNNNL